MSRITKTEFAAMIITAVLLAVAFGFFLGRNSGDSTVIVDGVEAAAEVTLPAEAPVEPEADEEPEISDAVSDYEALSLQENDVPSEAEEATEESSGLLNLNIATIHELEDLPNIGPVLAQRILDYREANGGFASVEELKNVDGIGDKIFESVVNLVEVGN